MTEIRWVAAYVVYGPEVMGAGVRFWERATGWRASAASGETLKVTLTPGTGDPVLLVRASGGQSGVGLDLSTDDVAGLSDRARNLGAAVVGERAGRAKLTSPGGLSFEVSRSHPDGVLPGATAWPGGRSLLRQLCVDMPAPLAAAETGFWAQLTGWPRPRSDLPEFGNLARAGMPLRLLLQTLGADDPGGVVRAHLDLACDDKDAEAARHVALGAELVARHGSDWTVLRDPGGLVYCCTARTPDHDGR